MKKFEEIRIRNKENLRLRKILNKNFKKAIKRIQKSELRCYDFIDLTVLYDEINEEFLK